LRVGRLEVRVKTDDFCEGRNRLLLASGRIQRLGKHTMALASERVEHDGAAGGRNARIEVPHASCKKTAYPQNLGIARREREGALVGFTRLREIEGSIFRDIRTC
jgi:hypothetical protein